MDDREDEEEKEEDASDDRDAAEEKEEDAADDRDEGEEEYDDDEGDECTSSERVPSRSVSRVAECFDDDDTANSDKRGGFGLRVCRR